MSRVNELECVISDLSAECRELHKQVADLRKENSIESNMRDSALAENAAYYQLAKKEVWASAENELLAQAAVIESLKRAIGAWDRAETPSELQSAEAGLLRALAIPTESTQILDEVRKQALSDTENQPNQYGVEFGMHGEKMMFKIGCQQFTLDYSPDEQDEFECMKKALIHAFSTFTPDVKIDEVRRAEREKCAVLCEKSDRYRGDYFAAKIRAME